MFGLDEETSPFALCSIPMGRKTKPIVSLPKLLHTFLGRKTSFVAFPFFSCLANRLSEAWKTGR